METALFTAKEAGVSIESGEGWVLEERTECWIWQDCPSSGIGPFLAFYEAFFGPAAYGMEVRHLCTGARRGCVRPTHLEAVPEDSPRRERDPDLLAELPGFARLIHDERDSRMQTRAEFAKDMRVSYHTVRAWEEGDRLPSPERMRWIARQLGWDSPGDRAYVITAIVQRVETARSSGQALRQAWAHIERMNGGPRKATVYSVKPR